MSSDLECMIVGNNSSFSVKKKNSKKHFSTAKWINKQRVLIFASRGIQHRDRHLMNNLRALLPHSKPDSKREKKGPLLLINEICEMKNCNRCIYFESKKHQDLYMWMSNVPNGPSVKFLVENVHTMEELKLTGNCLKASRPILSFDKKFDSEAHLSLLKELFVQVLGTPRNHPKSQPFFDHVFNFTILDNKIWFRNYQIEDDGTSLVEIGPRFVLNPIKVFDGSFCGSVLYTNPHYITPSMHRRNLKKAAKYEQNLCAKRLFAMRNHYSLPEQEKMEEEYRFKVATGEYGESKETMKRKCFVKDEYSSDEEEVED